MKKKLLILVISAICSVNLFAQEMSIQIKDRSHRFYLGPTVGLNYATMRGEPNGVKVDFKSGISFNAGLAANVRFGRATSASKGGSGKTGILLEALFSQHKVQTVSDDITINCFEVPVLFQFYAWNKKRAMRNFYFEIGPTISGSLSASPDQLKTGEISYAIGDVKYMDVFGTVGAGFKLDNGFNLNVRYNIGTSKLADNFPAKTNMLQLSVGWLFGLKK